MQRVFFYRRLGIGVCRLLCLSVLVFFFSGRSENTDVLQYRTFGFPRDESLDDLCTTTTVFVGAYHAEDPPQRSRSTLL